MHIVRSQHHIYKELVTLWVVDIRSKGIVAVRKHGFYVLGNVVEGRFPDFGELVTNAHQGLNGLVGFNSFNDVLLRQRPKLSDMVQVGGKQQIFPCNWLEILGRIRIEWATAGYVSSAVIGAGVFGCAVELFDSELTWIDISFDLASVDERKKGAKGCEGDLVDNKNQWALAKIPFGGFLYSFLDMFIEHLVLGKYTGVSPETESRAALVLGEYELCFDRVDVAKKGRHGGLAFIRIDFGNGDLILESFHSRGTGCIWNIQC